MNVIPAPAADERLVLQAFPRSSLRNAMAPCALLASVLLVACGDGTATGDATSDSPPSEVSVLALRDGGSLCQVEHVTLLGARDGFVLACGQEPVDCDPSESGWTCASVVIEAPSRVSPEVARESDASGAESPFVDGFELVEQWNELALAAIRAGAAKPTVTAHQLFMVSTAMYDAFAIYSDTAVPHALSERARRPADERTETNRREAVSVAAHTMLNVLFPDFEAEHGFFGDYLARLGYAAPSGIALTPAGLGFAAALGVAVERGADGSDFAGGFSEVLSPIYPEPYVPTNPPKPVSELGVFADDFDPNRWQPLRVPSGLLLDERDLPQVDDLNLDSFGDQAFLSPSWGAVTPFALSHGAELRPPGPPLYGSDAPYTDALGNQSTHHDAWVEQFTEVVRYSAELDDRGKFIAEFWADGPRTESPPGHWNQLAHGLIARDELTLDESVPLLFALNAALLDASIATWEAKRHYDYIRPATAIRFLFQGRTIEAWAGPNLGTAPIQGETWSPYQKLDFVTPPFPEYVSGHSTFSRASAEVLTRFVARREGLDPHDDRAGRFYDGVSRTRQDIDGDGSLDLFGEFTAPVGSFLIEDGPAEAITLRWTTFREAADEAGLSRLHGGIHIRDGDLRGRQLGRLIGERAFEHAMQHVDGTL